MNSAIFDHRRAAWAFWIGVIAVTAGVITHLPMFWMAKDMGFVMAGMPMGQTMVVGMGLIVGGIAIAGFGLLPPKGATLRADEARIQLAVPDDTPLSATHWSLMGVLVLALMIDVMKPASLGFIMPGLVHEYGVSNAQAALVPFAALVGTVTGSVLWGVLADIYGRKASILLSAVVFVGTSICGAMPSLNWNIFMCFLMGAGAGGMLPVTYALLAEAIPTKQRGWALVLVGGLGAVGGYFAASGFSALLVPTYSWRIMWLINLPTGLLLLGVSGFIPESAKFLLARGRDTEAHAVMDRFGVKLVAEGAAHPRLDAPHPNIIGLTAALSVAAVAWGLINFGLLLWLPAELVARGFSMGASSQLLAKSALIAFPTVFICALMYSRWSTKGTLSVMVAISIVGLVWILFLAPGTSPVLAIAMLVVGSNGVLAILLPYAAECYPLAIRARATGWVAACSKLGGVLAQTLSILALVPPLATVAAMIIVPTGLAFALTLLFGVETRGRALEDVRG